MGIILRLLIEFGSSLSCMFLYSFYGDIHTLLAGFSCSLTHIDFLFSSFHASSSPPPPVVGDMAMTFVDGFFLPLRLGLYFVFFTCFAGFVALPFRGVEVGFEEPHLRLML